MPRKRIQNTYEDMAHVNRLSALCALALGRSIVTSVFALALGIFVLVAAFGVVLWGHDVCLGG